MTILDDFRGKDAIKINFKRKKGGDVCCKRCSYFFLFCELESFLVINFNCISLSAGLRDKCLRECFRSCQIAFEKMKLILPGICTKAKVAHIFHE